MATPPIAREPVAPEMLESLVRGMIRQELTKYVPFLATAKSSLVPNEMDMLRWDDVDGQTDGLSYPTAGPGIAVDEPVLAIPTLDGFPVLLPGPAQGLFGAAGGSSSTYLNGSSNVPARDDHRHFGDATGIFLDFGQNSTVTTSQNLSTSTYAEHFTDTMVLPTGNWRLLLMAVAVYEAAGVATGQENGVNARFKSPAVGGNTVQDIGFTGEKIALPFGLLVTSASGTVTVAGEYKGRPTNTAGGVSAGWWLWYGVARRLS